MGPKKIRVFLASSNELATERLKFEKFLIKKSKKTKKDGIEFIPVVWENERTNLEKGGTQWAIYDQRIKNSDIFVLLVKTKVGQYTESEFDVAHASYSSVNKPFIYTYFVSQGVNENEESLIHFKHRLKELKHYYTEVPIYEAFELHLSDQIDKLIAEEKIIKKKRIWPIVLIPLLLVLLYLMADLYILPHKAYYKNFISTEKGWIGVDAISKNTAAKRENSTKFYSTGRLGKISSAEKVNGHDYPTGFESIYEIEIKQPCNNSKVNRFNFQYDDKGYLLSEIGLSSLDQNLITIRRSSNNRNLLAFEDHTGATCSKSNTGIYYIERQRTQKDNNKNSIEDFTMKTVYLNFDKNPARNSNNRYGYLNEYEKNRKVKSSPLDRDLNKQEICWVYDYNDAGDDISFTVQNQNGAPLLNERGIHKARYTQSKYGNILTRQSYNIFDELTRNNDGYAISKYEHDLFGNTVKRSDFDEDGEPAYSISGTPVLKAKYDDFGRLIERTFFNSQGEKMMNSRKYFKQTLEYDNYGNNTIQTYYDTNENHTIAQLGNDTYSQVKKSYNNRGYVVSHEIYDSNLAPMEHPNGIFKSSNTLDTNGNILVSKFYDSQLNSIDSEIRRVYDNRGNRLESKTYDEFGRPTSSHDGVFYNKYTWDQNGNKTTIENFDVNLTPTIDRYGTHKTTYGYDQFGNLVQEQYHDTLGIVHRNSDGDMGFKFIYDERGNRIQKKKIDILDLPGKHLITKYQYDGLNRNTSIKYYAKDMQPILFNKHYHEIKYEYDQYGNNVSIKHYGFNRELVEDEDGIAGYNFKHNSQNQQTEFFITDTNNELVIKPNGVAIRRRTYDEMGDLATELFFDEKETPIEYSHGTVGTKFIFDKNRNKIGQIFLNSKLEPVNRERGYAYIIFKYNSDGDVVEKVYQDKDGNIIDSKLEVATTKYIYNIRRKVISEKYFNAISSPVQNKYTCGCYEIVYEYDEFGDLLRKVHYDEKGDVQKS